MRLIDILSAPWAIVPTTLDEIQGMYARHMRGDKIDLEALTAATGIQFANEPKPYTVSDGVALLCLDGVIAKRMNLMTRICGGVSSDLVGRDFAAALEDRSVEAIVLAIDSPGGTVDGTPELAELVYRGRAAGKPIIAHTDGMMCSAAYWIGSAADKVMISSDVTMVGSIGVVSQHQDVSGAEAKSGVKTTEIYAGKYKRTASQYAPLTDEGRASIQDMVDHVYSVFVDQVGRHRGVQADEVLNRMADGRVFHGSQAIEAGLVDGVATLAEAMAEARALARGKSQRRPAGVAVVAQTKETTMDVNTLRTEHPDLVAEIVAEAQADMAAQVAAAHTAGAEAERARIADVRKQLIPGHEALIEALAFDGRSTGADAALAIVEAEKGLRRANQAAIDNEAPKVLPPVLTPDPAKAQIKREDFDKLGAAARRQVIADGTTIID